MSTEGLGLARSRAEMRMLRVWRFSLLSKKRDYRLRRLHSFHDNVNAVRPRLLCTLWSTHWIQNNVTHEETAPRKACCEVRPLNLAMAYVSFHRPLISGPNFVAHG
jgi:hypothetical protein